MKTLFLNQLVSHARISALFVLLALIVFACKDDDDPEGPALSITSFSPQTARVDDIITITGTGFNPTGSQNTVTFNGEVNAPVFEASATELKIRVPANAPNGPISVTVGKKTVVSTQAFTLDTSLGAPVLTSIDPTHGTAGQQVTITGNNFSTSIENIRVLFGETEATEIISLSNTTLVTRVPAEAVVGALQVSVLREAVSATTTLAFTVDPLPRNVKNCYWVNNLDNTINKGMITEEGKVQQVLYDLEDGVSVPRGVAVDTEGGYIYWCNTGDYSIMRAPIDGSGPVEVIFSANDGIPENENIREANDLALDLENKMVYFTNRRSGLNTHIYRGPFTGGPIEQLYSLGGLGIESPRGIKLEIANNALYWTEPDLKRVRKGALDGSTDPEILYEGEPLLAAYNIAVDDVNKKLYIIDGDLTGATSAENIFVGSLNGGVELQSILSAGDNIKSAFDIEIDVAGGYIYWLNSMEDGQLMRAKLDGSEPESIFENIDFGTFFDLDIQ